tara:strand:+ start:39 stop:773 length:735 start_codon:yes stop_codon:yes gene_type:complete
MKYVIFHNAADDSYMASVDAFRGAYANTETVDIYFESATTSAGYDKVVVACTNGEEDRAVEELAAAFSKNSPVITIADDVNSVYACQNITSVTSITLAGKGVVNVVETVTVDDTLTAADSGKTFVFGDAAAVLTLPDSGGGDIIGWSAKFISNFTATGQEVKNADTTNEIIVGALINSDTDDDNSTKAWNAEIADGFSSVEFTGVPEGAIGSYFVLTNIAADRWLVEGVVIQEGGSEATPFAAS